jgi:hypothetical protein
MPRAPPHSHGHGTPLLPLYCGRQPHRRHHRRGHPPPCRGPAAIGPCRRNSPHPRDPHQPPMLRHRFPTAKPDRRRRTAAGLAADRTPVELSPSLRAINVIRSPLSLACGPAPQRRSLAVAPRGWAMWAESAPAPARLRLLGRNPPPPRPSWLENPLSFSFPFSFSHFHIYI